MNAQKGRAELKRFLDGYSAIPQAEWEKFTSVLSTWSVARGGYLTRIGDRNHKIGFVLRGCLRVSYLRSNGSKYIRNFCPEGSLASSYTAALRGMESDVDIQAIEPSEVVGCAYPDFARLLPRHESWERLGRKLTEKYFLFREGREYQLLLQNSEERYDRFLEDFGGIRHRLSHSDIAAYIGVAPASFSRILKKRKSQKRK